WCRSFRRRISNSSTTRWPLWHDRMRAGVRRGGVGFSTRGGGPAIFLARRRRAGCCRGRGSGAVGGGSEIRAVRGGSVVVAWGPRVRKFLRILGFGRIVRSLLFFP